MGRQCLVLVLALLLGKPVFAAEGRDLGPRPPGAFDYYVLALTWVPGFCALESDPVECSKGLGFALHGLWPQDDDGDYPTFCSQAALSASDRDQFRNVYPSPSMIDHEWPKHGSCSGLSPAAYFGLSSADLAEVAIPVAYRRPAILRTKDAASVAQALVAVNPSLPPGAVRTVVTHGVLSEVDICLTKAGAFRPC